MRVACAIVAAGLFFPARSIHAAPTVAEASRLFADATLVCGRDHGALWGRSLCGPVLLVDYTDRGAIASAPDANETLHRNGAFFVGTLPADVIVANTPTDWSGVRWTQLVSPTPDDADRRRVLIAHELFHRIQPALGLTRPEAPNHHLDTFDGRYLLQLEWRALARALTVKTFDERRLAVADALGFRRERYRLFPKAAMEEGALEINEGIAEYTGVVVGMTTSKARIDYAVNDLSAFVSAPTFVRSFAYATGPAYGLLLDASDRRWRAKLAGHRLDELLAEAMRVNPVKDVQARAAAYDDGTLRVDEEHRDALRLERLATLRARLVDGPVVVLPLAHTNYQFNPQTLIAFDGQGTIYPTMRLVDDWGVLEVESGGALVRSRGDAATVTAVGVAKDLTSGDGWRLMLKPGWTIRSGPRPGDLVVACGGKCPPRQ